MDLIGDLERAFATQIYPNRVFIAILGLVLIVVLAVVARRRHWSDILRRRPRASLVAGAIALAIVLPVGWYLGSPLFISTTIDEPAPIAVVGSTATPSAQPSAATPPPGSAAPDPTPVEDAMAGIFEGADEFHFGSGTARLIETSPGMYTLRLEDFAVRNGPDLYVYLSPSESGYVPDATDLGQLKADRGNQNYEIPTGVDVAGVRSVVIWCKQFTVQFAVAILG